ncbi:PilZ domain-containing protein [Methylobacterium iners]|uniref:PilZ domain-containing protein n=1 Tax=Methylobacterium iners TaxID=418707 RepID=A0ABQ4RTK5_9HYPH|nr:PilZ domain-containing protein [Methylobacterium iners]GJD94115.1 hypothetical protein OCOJLMKI_1316 [Methylobacterium iners]
MTGATPERRREPRRRALLGADLSVSAMASTTACLVRDITGDGACLAVGETIPLPDTFDLTIPHQAATRRARLIWREGDRAGISFIRPRPAAVPVSLEVARDLRACRAENSALRARVATLEALD